MNRKAHRIGRAGAVLVVVAVGSALLTSCRVVSLVDRSSTPVVLTGAEVPTLAGTAPDRVVAFRHNQNLDGTGRAWTQIPVQVDQRKVVGFGSQPGNNTSAGTTGTVYGSGSPGVTALQYADGDTWVGTDPDPALDADDEIVFMASDAGGNLAPDVVSEPAGVVHHSGVALHIDDPRGTNEDGWVYLYESDGSLDPSARQDYVDYDFALTSGGYKSTYKRADGPNPETSTVTTDQYEVGFGDRWIEDSWSVQAPGASGVDILDGNKNQFAIDICGRSNVTFADAEGAFVANVDGPVRAIRSYIGANSGPLTQRTHRMYRDRMDVETNLRVHSIRAVMDFIDYNSAAIGMTYRSSTVPGGVTIDGNADAVASATPTWEAVDGPQGQVFTRLEYTTDISGLNVGPFYRDQTSPPETQCWGDGSFFGASGGDVTGGIPNTDPRSGGFATFNSDRITQFSSPAADSSAIPAAAGDWAEDLETPLTVTASTYRP